MSETIFGRMNDEAFRAAYARQLVQGVRHERQLFPGSPSAGESPLVTVQVGQGLPVDEVVCLITEPEPAVVPLRRERVDWNLAAWTYVDVWQGLLPAHSAGTIVRYQIRAHDRDSGESYWADDGAIYSYLVGDTGLPAWALPAIVYQIFPDRFYPGDGREWNAAQHINDIYGGTLRGVIDKLDYIAGMGFTVIWLNPFFPDDTHHGYHATDYFTVNPRLGSMDDIRELVDKAHERGIRLLLDFVGNHWGSKHETFQDALTNPDSPYRDWYYWRNWPDDYVAYFNVADLPKVNVDNPAARDYMLRSVAFWLGDVGFDGLRLDHADGPSMDFWTDVRAVARAVRPDAWMIGEAVRPPDIQLSFSGLFDGNLDFLLARALRETFAAGTWSMAEFDSFLSRHEAYFPVRWSRPSFLDNHDMDRFLWRAGGDTRRLKLAALCQFTLGGAPIVYNGTESGVLQQMGMGDEGSQGMAENRVPCVWDAEQDGELRDYFWYLIHMRRDHPALWRGSRRTVHLNATEGTYAYVREDGRETIIVGLNASDEPHSFSVLDRLRNRRHTFTLPPWSGDVSLV